MGRTCGGFAEQRLRGGPSGLGGALLRPQGDPWKEREDEGCLLLGGSGAEQCGKVGSLPLLPPSEGLWRLLLAEPLRGRLAEEPQLQHQSRAEV